MRDVKWRERGTRKHKKETVKRVKVQLARRCAERERERERESNSCTT